MSNYNRGQRGQRSQRPYNYNREESYRNSGNENRSYGNYAQEGNSGNAWDSAQPYHDYNEQSWYGRSRQGDFGNSNSGSFSHGNSNYGETRYGSGNQYTPRSYDRDFDSGYYGNRKSYEGGSYEGGYGNRGYNDEENRTSYGQGGYGHNFGSGYRGDSGYNTGNQGQQYGGGSYGNTYYGNDYNRERGLWDRTRDEVSSWFGNEDAERRREQDRRYAGSHRGKGPKGYSRSDDRIKEDINDRLSDNPYVDASDIDISVSNGDVVLSGKVSDRHDKRRAEDITEGVSGVKNVENRIRVEYDKSGGLSSFDTTARTTTQATERSKTSRSSLVES